MKRLIVKGKERILITPKQLQQMLEWFNMASNDGDNDITSKDFSLRDKILTILKD